MWTLLDWSIPGLKSSGLLPMGPFEVTSLQYSSGKCGRVDKWDNPGCNSVRNDPDVVTEVGQSMRRLVSYILGNGRHS